MAARDDVEPVAIVIGLGLVAFLGYEIWKGLSAVGGAAASAAGAVASGAQAVGGAVAAPIAQVIVWATSGSSVTPTGSVLLPDGSLVATANLAITYDNTVNAATFVYNGQIYWIIPNPSGGPSYDSNGNYHATAVAPVPSIMSVL